MKISIASCTTLFLSGFRDAPWVIVRKCVPPVLKRLMVVLWGLLVIKGPQALAATAMRPQSPMACRSTQLRSATESNWKIMSSGPRNRLKMPRKLPKRANRKIQLTREVKYWNTWNLQLIICDDSSSRLGHSTECNLARAGKCKGKFDYCLNSSIFYWKWARKHQPAACCCTGACRPPPQVVPTYAQVLRCCCVVVVVIFSRFFVPAGLKYTLQIHFSLFPFPYIKIPFFSLALGHLSSFAQPFMFLGLRDPCRNWLKIKLKCP